MTDIGRVRPRNEDQFAVADLSRSAANCLAASSYEEGGVGAEATSANLLVVADGVGGHPGGAWASRLAVEGVVEYLLGNRQQCEHHAECGGGQVLDDLTSALYSARECIQHQAEASPQHFRMGTTLTLAYLKWPVAYLAHAGDSRAYLYRTPDLIQITRDQTMAQMLVDAGALKPDQVESHPWRNALDSLLCRDERSLAPLFYQQGMEPGDQLLLCTDGLTKKVPEAQIAAILESALDTEEACRELIAAANTAGGPDNITVVLARFGHREPGSDPGAEFSAEASTVIRFPALMACLA
jgi:protein phosphatase